MSDLEIALGAPSAEHDRSVLERLLDRRRSMRRFSARPVSLADLAGLAWAAQGRTSDGRRVCPSAHALYPLSLAVVAGHVTGLARGIYRYDTGRHQLRLAAVGDHRDAVAAASLADYDWLRHAAVLLILSGDMETAAAHFADQPPRGRRGQRYVWLEAGCAAQNASPAETFVVFPGQVFGYPRGDSTGRAEAQKHGRRLGIPEAQLDWPV